MADTRLPAIHTLHVASPGAEEEKQKQTRSRNNVEKQASAFLSRLQLGYLQPMPKPGDIFHSSFLSPRQPRPLGLIPGRNDRMAALKKLNQLLSPWSVGQPSYLLPSVMDQNAHAEPEHPLTHDQAPSVTEEAIVGAISATIRPAKTLADSPPPKPLLEPSTEPTAYRLTSKGLPNTAAAPGVNVDPDYMGDKASQYYALLGEAPLPTPKPTNKTSLLPTALPLQNQRPLKQAKLKA